MAANALSVHKTPRNLRQGGTTPFELRYDVCSDGIGVRYRIVYETRDGNAERKLVAAVRVADNSDVARNPEARLEKRHDSTGGEIVVVEENDVWRATSVTFVGKIAGDAPVSAGLEIAESPFLLVVPLAHHTLNAYPRLEKLALEATVRASIRREKHSRESSRMTARAFGKSRVKPLRMT